MSFVTKTWKDRVAEYINRRTLTQEDGTATLVTVSRTEGTVSEAGDAFNAENMNDLETRISNAFGTTLTGTLSAGDTSITFTDSVITTSSAFDYFTSIYGVAPSDVTVTDGTLTLAFDVQTEDLTVVVIVKEI